MWSCLPARSCGWLKRGGNDEREVNAVFGQGIARPSDLAMSARALCQAAEELSHSLRAPLSSMLPIQWRLMPAGGLTTIQRRSPALSPSATWWWSVRYCCQYSSCTTGTGRCGGGTLPGRRQQAQQAQQAVGRALQARERVRWARRGAAAADTASRRSSRRSGGGKPARISGTPAGTCRRAQWWCCAWGCAACCGMLQ